MGKRDISEKAIQRRIGAITIDIEGAYSEMIWSRMSEAVKDTDFDLIVFPTYNPGFPYGFLNQNNVLFNFIRKQNIDVLIFQPDNLSNFISKEQTDELVNRIRAEVPVISLNTGLKGSPSILLDNRSGIKDAVNHLVRDHHYRRIAFMAGPSGSFEAKERKAAYEDALKELGIIPQSDWILPGDFTPQTSQKLALEKGPEIIRNFDAVVCANDYMAMGFIEKLKFLGFSIPGDLAVIGFDDINEAPFQKPPLTSIKQPFGEMITKAVELAVDFCLGKKVPEVVKFKSELVIRSTCGCENFLCDQIIEKKIKRDQITNSALVGVMIIELRKFLDPAAAERISNYISTLLDYLQIKNPSKEGVYNILTEVESVINKELYTYHSFHKWQYILSLLIDAYNRQGAPNSVQWKTHDLFEKIRLLIDQKEKLWTGYEEARRLSEYTLPLRSLQQNLFNALSLEEKQTVIISAFESLGIKNCHVSLVRKGLMKRGLYSTVEQESTLIFSYHEWEIKTNTNISEFQRFKTLDLLPPGTLSEPNGNTWFISPLFNRDNLFGFIISDCRKYAGAVFESVRHQLSVALHSYFLDTERLKAENKLLRVMEELEKNNIQLQEDSIRDPLTTLLNRRGFLKESAMRIKESSSKRVRFCLFFADMDGLKKINDTLGHATGDIAISDMASILKDIFREEDLIARLGGDEFTIFTIDTPAKFPSVIDDRLNNLLEEYNNSGKELQLSISMGHITGYTNDSAINLPALMEEADRRLYKNKKKKKEKLIKEEKKERKQREKIFRRTATVSR